MTGCTISGHIEAWRDSVAVGDEATVSQIVRFVCPDCDGSIVSAGAVAIRIFPAKGPCKIEGVEDVRDVTPMKARRIA